MAEELGRPEERVLGNFASGERPDPVTYRFLDYLGNPIDISSPSSLTFDISKDGAAPAVGAGATQVDGTDTSMAIYAWAAADMTDPGHYVAQFWVTKGSVVRASLKIFWWVYTGIKA